MITYIILFLLLIFGLLLFTSSSKESYFTPLSLENVLNPDCSLPQGGYHYGLYTCTSSSGQSASGRCTTPDPRNVKEPC